MQGKQKKSVCKKCYTKETAPYPRATQRIATTVPGAGQQKKPASLTESSFVLSS